MNNELEWVLVETVETVRMRYMVQVPKGNKDYALDTVIMREAKEFSQKYLDEVIVSHRVVNEDEILTMCNEDNEYCREWTDEKKISVFCTKEGEKAD
jgi:hypothetical protein